MNKLFKNSVANLSLIGLGTSFGCYQQNVNVVNAEKPIYWYQRYLPYFILSLFGIKCAKQVECENDMEKLSKWIKMKSLEMSVDYKNYNENYNELDEEIELLNERIEAIERSVENLNKSKEKLIDIRKDISGKEAYLNKLYDTVKWSSAEEELDSRQKQRLEEEIQNLENKKCEFKEILSKEEKLKADEEHTRQEYNVLKKKLSEEVRKSVESVCGVIKKEVKDGLYGENSICEVLKEKKINNFFTEDKIKDVPKDERGYKYELCKGDYYVKDVLTDVLNGKQVSEEYYEGFVEEILKELCDCDNNKISKNIKPESSNIVNVWCDSGFIKYADFPILFQKDSSLYRACELYMKINREFSSSLSSNKQKNLCSKKVCKSNISFCESHIKKIKEEIQQREKTKNEKIERINKEKEEFLEKLKNEEEQIPEIEENIGKLEKDISQAQQEMRNLIDERNLKNTELKKQKKALREQSNTNEENNKRAILMRNEKIETFRKNIVEKYSKESWFKKVAVKNGLLDALECS